MNKYLRWLLAVVLAGPLLAYAAYGGYLTASKSTSGLVTTGGVVLLCAAVYIWTRFRLRRSGNFARQPDDAKKKDDDPSLRTILGRVAPFAIFGYALLALDILGNGHAPGLLVLGLATLSVPFMRRSLRWLPPSYRAAMGFNFSKRGIKRWLWLGVGLLLLAAVWLVLGVVIFGHAASVYVVLIPSLILLMSGFLLLIILLFAWLMSSVLS